MITKLWYSVQDCSDGSAYPILMESEALCKIDQDFMDDAWGEPCYGCFILESDSPITAEEIVTVDEMIAEIESELSETYVQQYKREGKYPDWFTQLEKKVEALKILQKEQNDQK